VKALYAGEVSFVDKWVGYLLEKIKDLGLYDNSLIVLLADHGHPHGDHGSIMKTPDNLYSKEQSTQFWGNILHGVENITDKKATAIYVIVPENEESISRSREQYRG